MMYKTSYISAAQSISSRGSAESRLSLLAVFVREIFGAYSRQSSHVAACQPLSGACRESDRNNFRR